MEKKSHGKVISGGEWQKRSVCCFLLNESLIVDFGIDILGICGWMKNMEL
jgi:hypothetical protein